MTGVNLYTQVGSDAVFEAIANLSADIATQVNTPGSAIRVALDALYAAASSSGSQIRVGTGAPAGALGNLQDFYVDNASGNYYQKTTSTSWALQGNLTGPAGSQWQVTVGVPGAGVGANGDYALNGSTGDIYGPKASGAWGSIVANIRGGAGANGNTVLNGAGAPTGGNNGDFWIDTTNWRIYGPKAAGAWPGTYTSLIGATGAAGNTVLNGAGAPTGGNNGDFWIDTTNNRLYGPKAAGVWPGTYISLVGATGAAGSNLLLVSGVPSSGTGANGDFAIDQTTGNTYGPKAAGAWGSSTGNVLPTIINSNTQSGASYTFALSDAGKVVVGTNAGATTFTVPTHATVALPVNTFIQVMAHGTGQITIVGQSGVTLPNASSAATRTRYSVITLWQYATDEWDISGDMQ